MAGDENKLKLGKGVAFVKSQLHRLRQEDETWEADFRALPKLISRNSTHYLGMVLTQPDGFLRAELQIKQSPTVNDLATCSITQDAAARTATKWAIRSLPTSPSGDCNCRLSVPFPPCYQAALP